MRKKWERKVSSRFPVADSKHKVSSRLPIQNIKIALGCRLSIQNIKLAVGCRLPGCRFSSRFDTDKFNESATGTSSADSIADNRQVQRIGNWQVVAGCRFGNGNTAIDN